jgi:glycosyltransferase involved in cell wall biosynthesis
MRAGFLHAHRNGFAAVLQLDADGQHDPAQVPVLLEALDEQDVDVVVGARFDGEGDYVARGPRRWAMYLLAKVVSWRTGVRLTDVTSGFRVAGPRAVALFAQRYPADYLGDTVESLLLAHSAGLRLCQQPVRMRSRSGGLPSTSPLRSTLYLLRALLVLVVFLARGRSRRRSATGS